MDVSTLRPLREGDGVALQVGRSREGAEALLLHATTSASGRVGQGLDALAHAHRVLDDPLIPRVGAQSGPGEAPWLVLLCDARHDGIHLLERVAEREAPIPYEAAMGALLAISRCIQRAHDCVDPEGKPMAFGPLLPARFLYSPTGQMWLLGPGLGHLVGGSKGWPLPPEVSVGAPLGPASDVVAIATLMRVMAPYIDFPPVLRRVLSGRELPEDRPVARAVRTASAAIWSLPPPMRPSLSSADRALRRMFDLLGVRPDLEGYRRHIARVFVEDAPAPAAPSSLRVADDGAWFQVGEAPVVRLSSRASQRRLLRRLLHERLAHPGAAVDVWALLAAGWPGERPSPEAGASRVYTALASLRRMGLRPYLERFDGGYRLAPGSIVIKVDDHR